MPRTSRIDRDGEEPASLLLYQEDIADLMSACVCMAGQAHETFQSMQSDSQSHIYHLDFLQLGASILSAENEYTEVPTIPLQEKDILIREAHHLIKNSLQLVQSLLSLQASQTANEVASRQLQESAARVRVIGAMHDRLYRSETMLEVEVGPYLKALVEDLRQGLASTIPDRSIMLNADHAIWAADDISTLGLILTELVTNALKYGAGTINIYFYQEIARQAVLIVEDEGTLAAEFDLKLNAGFGIRLIQRLVAQRDGALMVDGMARHTRFIAVMPRPKDETAKVSLPNKNIIIEQPLEEAAA